MKTNGRLTELSGLRDRCLWWAFARSAVHGASLQKCGKLLRHSLTPNSTMCRLDFCCGSSKSCRGCGLSAAKVGPNGRRRPSSCTSDRRLDSGPKYRLRRTHRIPEKAGSPRARITSMTSVHRLAGGKYCMGGLSFVTQPRAAIQRPRSDLP